MSSERADVLVVGAGASGGVVGKRLAEAGFAVVCLEQGEWPDRADYPGPKPDWELQALRRWSADPRCGETLPTTRSTPTNPTWCRSCSTGSAGR